MEYQELILVPGTPADLGSAEDSRYWARELELARLARAFVCSADPNTQYRQARRALAKVPFRTLDDIVAALRVAGTPFTIRTINKRQLPAARIQAALADFLRHLLEPAARIRAAGQHISQAPKDEANGGIFGSESSEMVLGDVLTASELTLAEQSAVSQPLLRDRVFEIVAELDDLVGCLPLETRERCSVLDALYTMHVAAERAKLRPVSVSNSALEVFQGVTGALQAVGAPRRSVGIAQVLTGRVLELAGLAKPRPSAVATYCDQLRLDRVRKALKRARQRRQ